MTRTEIEYLTETTLHLFSKTQLTGQLHQAVLHFHLSPRAYDRILKVARTIADLAGSESIEDRHLMEAVSFRKTGLPDA